MNTTTSARNGTRRFLLAFGAIGAPLLAASGAAAEQSYAVTWRITNVDPSWIKNVDVRVTWNEPSARPLRRSAPL